jgi:hypothetical protein
MTDHLRDTTPPTAPVAEAGNGTRAAGCAVAHCRARPTVRLRRGILTSYLCDRHMHTYLDQGFEFEPGGPPGRSGLRVRARRAASMNVTDSHRDKRDHIVVVHMGTLERCGPYTLEEARAVVNEFNAEVAKRADRDWWLEDATFNQKPYANVEMLCDERAASLLARHITEWHTDD